MGQPSTGKGAASQGMSLGEMRFNGARTFEKVPGASGDVQAQMRFIECQGRRERVQDVTELVIPTLE